MALPWLFSALPGQFTCLFFWALVEGAAVEVVEGAAVEVIEGAVGAVVVGVVVVLLVPEPEPEPEPVPAKVAIVEAARKAAAAVATVIVCAFMVLSESGIVRQVEETGAPPILFHSTQRAPDRSPWTMPPITPRSLDRRSGRVNKQLTLPMDDSTLAAQEP